MSKELVDFFCESMSNYPEIFRLLSCGRVYHTGSSIFYDSENGVLSHFTYIDDYDPDDNSEDFIKDMSFINISEDDTLKLHKSYIEWRGWYDNEKNKKILDIALESMQNPIHEEF